MKTNTIIKTFTLCAVAGALFACGDNKNDFSDIQQAPPVVITPPVEAPQAIPNFDTDGVLEATIRWTNFGVPHVIGDNLESTSFGQGYAFARDNACVLADQIIKYNSERAKYLGPDRIPGSGDSEHLINDFGFLTLGIREMAEEKLATMSANSRAMVSGYTQGYNKFLAEAGPNDLDPSCAGQPWLQAIDSVDLLTYSFGIALLPGAANFLGPMFIAAPPGEDYLPTMAIPGQSPLKIDPKVSMPESNPQDLGSNGWGLGSDMTENGMGMVLGNPHFPHTGNLRFWQSHITIPGHMNVMGGSLMGLPGAINIGFNENVAWTHTFSTAEHFVVYQLQLDDSDPSNLTHSVDGAKRTIFSKDMTIDVAVAPGQTIKLNKRSYFTNYGPIIEVPGNFEWGPGGNAFAIKDANLPNVDIIDHWLAMNLAGNMEEFKQAFRDYDGVIFNNTMAASKDGQVFYIDDSTVPNLTDTAIGQLTTNPLLVATKQAAGFTVLPGFSSAFDFAGPVPFENAPQYSGVDYVQNSNDSFWLSNLDTPITGVSPLFGQVGNQQSLRSRHAHVLLASAGGSDNKFSPNEVESALLANRSYLSDIAKSELVAICEANKSTPVDINGSAVDLSPACDALALWDGTMNLDSVGAHIFREFAFQFRRNPQWMMPFDMSDPVNTPNGLVDNDITLMQLATGVKKIVDAGIPLDATLGEVQFVEKSTATGMPSGEKLPWGGAHNVEGGFNVFDVSTGNNGTEIPRHTYPTIDGTTRLSETGMGYHISSGSSWMMVVNYTDEGPSARGLLTYSQSHSPSSENFDDQSKRYSMMPDLRPLFFTEEDIAANLVTELSISNE